MKWHTNNLELDELETEKYNRILEAAMLSIEAMRKAAELWAQARNAGTPTVAPSALEADVILSAQVQKFAEEQGIALADTVIATTNMGHLA